MGLLKPIRDYVDTLVHPSAQHDALTASRHRAFIAPRLLGSVVALAAFPIYIAMRGVPGTLEVLVFAWLVLPILTAYYLSRTGQYESAHVLSSLALTGLVTAVAADTGGIASFAAIWLVVVPLEAALSASRRVVALASTFALVAAGLLLFLGTQAMLPPPGAAGNEVGALAALGIISAALYATGLALGAESLARTSFWLLYAEEDRYRLLARNMTDVITRHGRNGAVLFVSPAAETLFGAKVERTARPRLFDRVHVADRPAYLTALADAAALGEARSVEFRVRRDPPEHEDGAAAARVAVHLGRDALPAARPRRRRRRRRRSRGGRGDARRHRAQDAGAGARGGPRRGRSRQRRQGQVPRQHEPRAAHAAQRHHRLLGHADERGARCGSTPRGGTNTRS